MFIALQVGFSSNRARASILVIDQATYLIAAINLTNLALSIIHEIDRNKITRLINLNNMGD